MTKTEINLWRRGHSVSECIAVDEIANKVLEDMEAQGKALDHLVIGEVYHAAIIAWENPLGGQLEIDPETNAELRQMMEE